MRIAWGEIRNPITAWQATCQSPTMKGCHEAMGLLLDRRLTPPHSFMESSKKSLLILATVLLACLWGEESARAVEEPAAPEEAAAEEAAAPERRASLDEQINSKMTPLAEAMSKAVFVKTYPTDVPFVLIWLGGAAVFLTLFFKFVNLRCIGLAIRTIKGKYSSADDPGQITHFQALSAALSATVGLGNIAGVAVAINLGGPGATFWMIVFGLLGMTTKFSECTLGVKYRTIDETGKVYGGPMYYLRRGLQERGIGWLGIGLAYFFATMCFFASLGGGNMFQVNQACTQFVGVTGGEASFFNDHRWIYGLVMAMLVGLVVIGGIVSIAKVTSKLVPSMCTLYVLAALVIIVTHIRDVPAAFGAIIQGAFDAKSVVSGGFIAVLIQGLKRATFSNEAGVGSAPIAHSAVKTRKPASEGLVALLEPFMDTVVVCTMTALVIVITGTYELGLSDDTTAKGIEITSNAFASVITWFPYLLFVAVTLFAFSTLISWSYYGQQAWAFLFGRGKWVDFAYKFIFCAFVVIGSSMSLKAVIDFSDAALFAMAFPNLLGVYILLPVIKKEFESYVAYTREIDSKPDAAATQDGP